MEATPAEGSKNEMSGPRRQAVAGYEGAAALHWKTRAVARPLQDETLGSHAEVPPPLAGDRGATAPQPHSPARNGPRQPRLLVRPPERRVGAVTAPLYFYDGEEALAVEHDAIEVHLHRIKLQQNRTTKRVRVLERVPRAPCTANACKC